MIWRMTCVCISGGGDRAIVLWSCEDVTPLGVISTPSSICVLSFMPETAVILAAVFNHGVLAYDCIDGALLKVLVKHKYAVWGLAYGTS